MKAIYESDKIYQIIDQTDIDHYFSEIPGSLHILQYEAGETISSASTSENLFQILVSGTASIFYIRADGNVYSLAHCQGSYIIGESELFFEQDPNVFATAGTECTCIAVSIKQDGEQLLNDAAFLRIIANALASKLRMISNLNAVSSSLKERVTNYITYYCENHILSGVEQTAWRLHCSPRQLQRILNELVSENKIVKTGKGTYALICPLK
ncbi:MAG: cyclic nucleotide-binding domain-containing protein [Eubacteriales bacterium]|nr:cyclic nucleotide-binding domain-containing protein [Eubacteriales bacterium]